MAISKERLEELINNDEQKIYYISNITNNNLTASVKQIEEYKNLKELAYLIINGIDNFRENLFETKLDAEFALELGDIKKEEKLNLPTFEEITTNDKYNYYGISYFGFNDYTLMVKLPSEDDDREFIRIYKNRVNEEGCWEEATKENYIDACKLCRSLFLGEKV